MGILLQGVGKCDSKCNFRDSIKYIKVREYLIWKNNNVSIDIFVISIEATGRKFKFIIRKR